MTSIKSIKFSNIQMLWSNAWRNERDDSVQKLDVRKPVGYVNEMCRTISNFHFIVLWLNCLKVFECHSLRCFCYVGNPTQNLSVWCSLLNKKHYDEYTQLLMGIDCIVVWLFYVRRNEHVLIHINLRLHEKYWGWGGGVGVVV